MRTLLPYIMKKNILCIPLILVLIVSMILVSIPRAQATDSTTVAVNPSGIPNIALGKPLDEPVDVIVDPSEKTGLFQNQSFNVSITVLNVTQLGAWQFELYFNNSLLNATWVYKTWLTNNCTDWVPFDPGTGEFDPLAAFNNTYNATHGRVTALALIPLTTPFTGDGPLVTISFTAIAVGNCTLDLGLTVLGGCSGPPLYQTWEIFHDTDDGNVEVIIPEFPAVLVVPLLLISTLAAAFLGKKFLSRKRKDALNIG